MLVILHKTFLKTKHWEVGYDECQRLGSDFLLRCKCSVAICTFGMPFTDSPNFIVTRICDYLFVFQGKSNRVTEWEKDEIPKCHVITLTYINNCNFIFHLNFFNFVNFIHFLSLNCIKTHIYGLCMALTQKQLFL